MSQKSPYEYYLSLLGSWPTGIALASQWMVTIYFNSVSRLFNNLEGAITDREQSLWTYDKTVTKVLLDGGLQAKSQANMGCVFARQVVLPSENIEASNQGLDYGGFMAPATAGNRQKYDPVTVTMLETNASFLDLIIRPWTIMVGYNGLISRPVNSSKYVKADAMDVVFYAKTGFRNPMGVRKIYRFYNVAPISIAGETYSHNEEGLRYTDVKFVYDKYCVLDGETSDLIYLP